MAMKHFISTILLLTIVAGSQAQIADKGWYYFRNPASNIFGIGFNKPKNNKDLNYVGANIQVNDTDLIVLQGPNDSYYADNAWKKMVLTSLFSTSENILINVRTFKLKRVILPGKKWQEFNEKNYYVTEALRADSVFITGKIIKSTTADSKDLEKAIAALAAEKTIAFKVVNALTNKDTTIVSKGLISYETGRKDTFAISIRQPDVYFASKFIQLKSNAVKDYWREPASHPFENEYHEKALPGNNKFELLQHYFSNLFKDGVTLKLSFVYDKEKNKGSIVLDEQKTGSLPSKPIIIETQDIDADNPTLFDGEYPYITDPKSAGYSKAEKFLTLIDYKLEFDLKTRKLKIFGYQTIGNQSTYQTCIYQIRNKIRYWP